MNKPPNIYSQIVYDLHRKVSDFIDKLKSEGQIDLDEYGYPYIISVSKEGPNHLVQFVRNNKQENFLLNPRKRSNDPFCSWNKNDGYVRTGGKTVIFTEPNNKGVERAKRRTTESIRRLIEQIVD